MLFRKIVMSPLLHFFALGGLVFVVYGLMNPPAENARRDDVLVLSEAEAGRLVEQFRATWKRPPADEELMGLMRDWAAEEMLVREALALGLDRGDVMVRNRLRQKMLFLAEAPAASSVPDDAELDAYYAATSDRYARPPVISFEQVLLPENSSDDDVHTILAALDAGADPTSLGQATLLPSEIERMTEPAVERVFGNGFGSTVADLQERRWSGPLASGYGRHLVRLDDRADPELPPLDNVRDRVLADWRADKARELRDAYIDTLLGRVTIEFPENAPEAAGQ